MGELLTRFCGPNWESDLLDSPLPVSMVAVPNGVAGNGSFSSPALRTRLGPRPSVLGTPTGGQREGGGKIASVPEGDDSFEGDRSGLSDAALLEAQVAAGGQAGEAEAVRQQLEAVQAVIRAMQVSL